MFNNLSTCRVCKSQLVDGGDVERAAQLDKFSCEIRNIPTKICPSGCLGNYWYWLDFGVEVFDALEPKSTNIAKRKLGLFKSRNFCRTCSVELQDLNIVSTFVFHKELQKGSELVFEVSAPSLTCPECKVCFLPPQSDSGDPYYVQLVEVIQKAITDNLIYE